MTSSRLLRLVLAHMLVVLAAATTGCGLKGGLYIPEPEAIPGDAETEIETETEFRTGTGTGIETEIELEPAEVEPEEQPASNPD